MIIIIIIYGESGKPGIPVGIKQSWKPKNQKYLDDYSLLDVQGKLKSMKLTSNFWLSKWNGTFVLKRWFLNFTKKVFLKVQYVKFRILDP